MKPKELKEANIVEGTHQWEAKVAAVHHQYNEKPTDNMMAAIFLGMLPSDYQKMAIRSLNGFQNMRN